MHGVKSVRRLLVVVAEMLTDALHVFTVALSLGSVLLQGLLRFLVLDPALSTWAIVKRLAFFLAMVELFRRWKGQAWFLLTVAEVRRSVEVDICVQR